MALLVLLLEVLLVLLSDVLLVLLSEVLLVVCVSLELRSWSMHCELASTSDTREGKRVRLGPVEARLEPLADWEAPEEDREERCAAVAAI